MKKRKWREVCILGREIVSRLTGECRPVFRPTDEWSGRLSYIHNPQALGIIIIIIIILASSWLSSPSELCSSSYSINCHCTQNPRSFLASAYHINPENCNCLNQNSKKILLFLVFLYFSALFLPSVLTSHVLPFWNQNLSWQIIAPPPSSSSSPTSSSSFHQTKTRVPSSSPPWCPPCCSCCPPPRDGWPGEYRYFWWIEGRRIRWWLMNDPLPIGAGLGTT